MKQAMGEANMTIVVVIIIAVLSTFFFSVIWPRIRTGFRRNTRCDEAICVCNGSIINGVCPEESIKCTIDGKDIKCPWKG